MQRTLKLRLGHASMLYKVSQAQAKHDAEAIFKRGFDWITGTEAGENPVQSALRDAADKYNYKIFIYQDNWIAVEKSTIDPDSWFQVGNKIIDNDKVIGPGHDTNVARVTFKHKILGTITILCSHYPTKGRPVPSGIFRRNLRWTRFLARAIGALGRKFGKGRALVFYGGDQNIIDRINDTFFGQPFTSAWDEIGRYENTGHGNIDVIASYDSDKRVECTGVRALDDFELQLFTDHYLVEAGYRVGY